MGLWFGLELEEVFVFRVRIRARAGRLVRARLHGGWREEPSWACEGTMHPGIRNEEIGLVCVAWRHEG